MSILYIRIVLKLNEIAYSRTGASETRDYNLCVPRHFHHENSIQDFTSNAKNEQTLVNWSQLHAGTTLQQYALEQALTDHNWYLAFVKMELIPRKLK